MGAIEEVELDVFVPPEIMSQYKLLSYRRWDHATELLINHLDLSVTSEGPSY